MDIGQASYLNGGAVVAPRQPFKPFARPRLKRRRVSPTKPSLFAVRPNPSHYILDFSETAKSIERAVCSLLQSDRRTVSVVGLPGSGKTVILRGVAYHPAVYSHFPDGICLVQMGSQATVDILFTHFCEIMTRMGGLDKADMVRGMKLDGDYDGAMDLIFRFLKEKRFLLILDNISDGVPDVIRLVAQLLKSTSFRGPGRFTILSSTRNVDIARQFGGRSVLHLELHDPCGESARNILCVHAGFDRHYFDTTCTTSNSAALSVLRKCSGLPLALAIAGGAIKRLLKGAKTPRAKDLIWRQYKTYLFDNFDQFGDISGLFKALTACRLSIEAGQGWNADMTAMDVLSSLSVARHGVWIPFQVLQRLWGLKRKESVMKVVRPLSRLCLVSKELRRGSAGILIPDIIIDFCDHIARKSSGVHKWHVTLLSSYSGQYQFKANGGVKKKPEDLGTSTTFDEDQYLQETLAYHLSQALDSVAEDKAEASRLTAAVDIIQNRIAQKYESRGLRWSTDQR